MARKCREYYLKNLNSVSVNCDEMHTCSSKYTINTLTILECPERSDKIIPRIKKDDKMCIQAFDKFEIYYPLSCVFLWPKDIWLPNPEAENHMLAMLNETYSGILGYWNENILIFIVKKNGNLGKDAFENFFRNIKSIELNSDNDLVVKADYTST